MPALCNFCCSKTAKPPFCCSPEFLNLKVLNKVCVAVAAGTERHTKGTKQLNLICFTALSRQRVKVAEANCEPIHWLALCYGADGFIGRMFAQCWLACFDTWLDVLV